MNHPPQTTIPDIDGLAIIGMACRFPGAKNIDEFWRNLQNGIESLTHFSDEELAASGIAPAMRNNSNYVKAGAILEDVEQFDAGFFDISAAEATMMDPQHRVLLECAWEALENSGYPPDRVNGSVGIYAGSRISEYLLFNQPPPNLAGLDDGSLISNFQRLIGNDKDYLTTRISFKLNLTGPSLTVQTACSTSLVAVHLACESLLNGECDLALAGGVSIRVPQKAGYLYSQGMIFSSDGHTRAFDANASGTIFSSGAGIVVLKRLEEALADDDHIYAIIRGSAINNDGATGKVGYTAPSQTGQASVIAQAMDIAGVEPETVTYIETHGTGTALGDVIEIAALTDIFRAQTEARNFCALGAVKSNIGHTVQAAGVAGLIKTALMLNHKCLVPSLNFERPNPQLDLEDSPFYINTALREWPADGGPRRAGVSSFGVGGTNAHVVLEEPPTVEQTQAEAEGATHLLTLSAKNEAALQDLAARYKQHLTTTNNSLTDICFTTNVGRAHFPHRLAVIANTTAEMDHKLAAFVAGEDAPGLISSPDKPIARPKIAFLFTGQGAQYIGMGRQLYHTQPVFREAMNHCAEILAAYLEKPLLDILYPDLVKTEARRGNYQLPITSDQSPINQTAYTQPLLFALEYALAQLWQSWGITPAVVMGHSAGEYVAACIAGVLSLEDGLRLITERGRLMQNLPAGGEMTVIFTDEARVVAAIAPYSETVSIAAINGPRNIVISGLGSDIRTILQQLQAEGIRTQPLTVSHAFHSPLVESMLADFERIAAEIAYQPPVIDLISNLTGQLLENAPDATYWRRHARETIQFSMAMETLHDQGCNILIEIGPQPTLLGMGRRCWPDGSGLWLPSLRKEQPDETQIFQSLATLYLNQVDIDWFSFEAPYGGRRLPLPAYPFQRQRYWLEPSRRQSTRRQPATKGHPLLGRRLPSPLRETQFHNQVTVTAPTFLTDHRVHGSPIFPATAYIEMVCAAVSEVFADATGAIVIEELVIQQALLLAEETETTLQLILTPEGEQAAMFQIFSLSATDGTAWQKHASGKVRVEPATELEPISLETLQVRCLEAIPTKDFYQRKRERGLRHGLQFQGVVQIGRSEENGESLGYIQQPDTLPSNPAYRLHPALLDACLQIGEVVFPNYGQAGDSHLYLPLIWERITIYDCLERSLWSHATRRFTSQNEVRALDLQVLDESGQVVVEVEGLHFKRASRWFSSNLLEISDNWLHEVIWQPQPLSSLAIPSKGREDLPSLSVEAGRSQGKWLIFADQGGSGSQIAEMLTAQGHACTLVFCGDDYDVAGRYTVNPTTPADFSRLLDEIGWSGGGILYLWGLVSGSAIDDISASAMQADQALSCGGLLHLVQALSAKSMTEATRLWLITRGSQMTGAEFGPVAVVQTSLWGLGRVVMREQPDLRPTLLDLDPAGGENELEALLSVLTARDTEQQIALRHNERYVARLISSQAKSSSVPEPLEVPGYPYKLDTSQRGILENFKLHPQERRLPGSGEVEIRIHAAGLNFRDVLNALGQLPGPIGRECSGVIVACGERVTDFKVGDAVVAVFTDDSFGSFVTVDARYVAPKPTHLSFEAAATIPIVFLTAYYSLHQLAQISAGDRILIHAASGGVGLAVIQLAQQVGAEIFGTASRRKWAYLKSLGIQHVLNSRSLDFADEIMRLTEGEGVDIVLNSLAGEFIPKSLSLLTPGGRFIELGATDTWDEERMAELRPDVTYTEFHLRNVSEEDAGAFQAVFRQLMQDFERGLLKPLPQRVFPIQEIIHAFRTMAQAKHIGKIVISNRTQIPELDRTAATTIAPNKTYLLSGGLGGLGLKVAAWLVEQGARHLLLMGRSAPAEVAQKAISQMEAAGAQVIVAQADVSQAGQVANCLATIEQTMPPLRGIIHAAGLLDDDLLPQQTWPQFEKVMQPKIAGAWNLHTLTTNQPLDFFILFSSSTALLGGPGQSNYAAANAFLDGLAHYRRSRGLTAVSINWGTWAEVGMAANLATPIQEQRAARGMGQIRPAQGLRLLGHILHQDETNIAILPIDWPKYLRQFLTVPAFFSQLERQGPSPATITKLTTEPDGVLQQLGATPPPNHHHLLIEHIRGRVAQVLGRNSANLAVDRSLLELGVDSLMALELRNRITTDLKINVPIVKFMEGPTISQIAALLLEQLGNGTAERIQSMTSIQAIDTPDGDGDWEEGEL